MGTTWRSDDARRAASANPADRSEQDVAHEHFLSLMTHQRDELVAAVMRITGSSRDDAEDVVQDLSVKALQERWRFDSADRRWVADIT